MSDSKAIPGNIVTIDETQVRDHLGKIVRGTVEETLNGLLDAEADHICQATRYERSAKRQDTRAGHYERKLHTKAGEVTVKVPKLRKLPFETAIIERYRRREASVEEALIEMWASPTIQDTPEPVCEAASNASGLMPPRWLWRRTRL